MRLFQSLLLAAASVAATAASAAEPTAAQPSAPLARVEANRVVHPGEGVTVGVPATATYVGGDRFTLYGVADAEVHLFIEAEADRTMKRLWWVQFESYLPEKPELAYDYSDNRPMALGGVRTWLRSNPVPTGGPMRAGSDREAVFRILQRGGYPIPPEVMNVRMVQLLDDPAGTGKGRRELMIIYSENLAPTGRTLAELTSDGKPNEQWAPLEKALIARATGSVTVERRPAD